MAFFHFCPPNIKILDPPLAWSIRRWLNLMRLLSIFLASSFGRCHEVRLVPFIAVSQFYLQFIGYYIVLLGKHFYRKFLFCKIFTFFRSLIYNLIGLIFLFIISRLNFLKLLLVWDRCLKIKFVLNSGLLNKLKLSFVP
jgi:hypothetical protein